MLVLIFGTLQSESCKLSTYWRQLDSNPSPYHEPSTSLTRYQLSGLEVDFKKVGCAAQIIEIALIKMGARPKACSTPLKSFSKVGHRCKTVYEIDP